MLLLLLQWLAIRVSADSSAVSLFDKFRDIVRWILIVFSAKLNYVSHLLRLPVIKSALNFWDQVDIWHDFSISVSLELVFVVLSDFLVLNLA